jgi:hypothetical protein
VRVDPASLRWLERELGRIQNGEVGLVFHLREGKVEWTEKMVRETRKADDCSTCHAPAARRGFPEPADSP